MTKVHLNQACGNSPKNQLLQELTVAIAKADFDAISRIVTEDVRWSPVGRKPVHGVGSFCRAIARYGPASMLRVDQVISHGKSGAVNGVVTFAEKSRGFCYVVEFRSAKGQEVSGITSYSIGIDQAHT